MKNPLNSLVSRSSLLTFALIPLVSFAPALIGTRCLSAQTPAAHPSSSSTHKAQPKHRQSRNVKAAAEPEKVSPAAPELPNWPVNNSPTPASVTWDSHGLRIDAANSSLQQILHDVTTETGIKVEGTVADQRIFGDYGPGEARDVLSQLLHGSGYNVLMIGDQGQGTPRQVVLSARTAGTMSSANNPPPQESGNEDAPDGETDYQPPPSPPMEPIRNGFGPGGPPRTPQQMIQEMEQRRQQQLQQQQQQQQR